MPKLLTLLPDYEAATSGWSRVAKVLLDDVTQGFEHVVLAGDDCTPANVHNKLREDPDIIGISGLSVGHGNTCVTTVQYGQPEFACGWSVNALLSGRYFNKCSCLVGSGLLQDLVRYGLAAGCGERTEYWIYITWNPDPKKDIAFYFVDANYEFDRLLMKGKTAKEAYEGMIAKYYENAKKVEYLPDAAKLLRYDADNRKFFGDPNWRAPPPSQPPSPPPQPPTPPTPPQEEIVYQGDQDGNMYGNLSGTVEYKLFGLIPVTMKFDNIYLQGDHKGSHRGKVETTSEYLVTIDYDFVSSTDLVERYVGRTIDEPIKPNFWESQPNAVIRRAQHGISFREVVKLKKGKHYVEVSTSGYYPEWTATVYVNGMKIGQAFVGRDKPAHFEFIIDESNATAVGKSYEGEHSGETEAKASGSIIVNIWLGSKRALTIPIKVDGKLFARLKYKGKQKGTYGAKQ